MYHVWKSHHSLFNHLATADSDRLNMTKTQVMLDTWLHVNCLIPYGNEFFTIPEHAHHPNTTQTIRVLLLSLDEAYNKSQPSCLETRMVLKWKWNKRSSPTQKSKTTLSSLIPPNSTPSLRWRWENWCHTISFTKPPAWWPPRQRWIKNVPVTQKQLSLPPSLRAKHTTTLDCIPCNFRTVQNDKVMSFSKLFREKGNWYQSLQAQMAIPGTPGTWHWATKAPNPSACLS